MWARIFVYLMALLQADAFLDWNLQEVVLGSAPKFAPSAQNDSLLLSASLASEKNWKKARKAAVVKPFAGKVKSYSGFFTVHEEYNSNMFFWFFPCEKTPRKKPVILWLHGGPGQSSLMGLFEESGPYKIVGTKATLRETSWTKYYNVLYVDNPIGAGYSYTDDKKGYSKSISEAVDNLYEVLTQFYKMFPEYKKNSLYVIGQSYGGKYIPPLTLKIHDMNKKNDTIKMNIKGVLIGCGCLDPVNQIAYGKYLYEMGIVDTVDRDKILGWESRARDLLALGHPYLAAVQLGLIGYKMMKVGFNPPLDSSDPHIDLTSYDEVEAFVTRDDIRKAIHVGDAQFHDKKVVIWYFRDDLLNSVSTELSRTVQLGYKMLLYGGQHDLVIPHEQTDRVVDNLDWDELTKFKNKPVERWISNQELAGYYRSHANLKQVFVRKANHMIVRSQQKWMLDLLKSFATD